MCSLKITHGGMGRGKKKCVNDGKEETPRNLENASSETHVMEQLSVHTTSDTPGTMRSTRRPGLVPMKSRSPAYKYDYRSTVATAEELSLQGFLISQELHKPSSFWESHRPPIGWLWKNLCRRDDRRLAEHAINWSKSIGQICDV